MKQTRARRTCVCFNTYLCYLGHIRFIVMGQALCGSPELSSKSERLRNCWTTEKTAVQSAASAERADHGDAPFFRVSSNRWSTQFDSRASAAASTSRSPAGSVPLV